MSESVTVNEGSVSITTNTATEADLRAEMTAPPEAPVAAPQGDGDSTPLETPAQAAARARDERGRFAKAETPPNDTQRHETPPETTLNATEPPARRRDDTLPRHDPIARMKVAIAQKAQAEQRAAALEAELQRLRQPAPESPRPAPTNGHGQGEPQFEQFADQADPYTAYVQAWTRWDRQQGLAQARAEWDAEQATKAQVKEFTGRLEEGRKQYPDYDQVLTEADTLGLQVSAVMQVAITESPKAADLVYYLATHPEECTQLAAESQGTPVAAAPVMRRLLESHLAPRAAPSNGSGPAARAPVNTAKPPVQPVGSSPVVGDEPPGESASAAEHARYWNRRLRVPGSK